MWSWFKIKAQMDTIGQRDGKGITYYKCIIKQGRRLDQILGCIYDKKIYQLYSKL